MKTRASAEATARNCPPRTYTLGMSKVRLSGQLVCRDQDQVAIVAENPLDHMARARAELGCISFDVVPTEDPMIWQVDECFQDGPALTAHQERVAGSEWGRATAAIERRYAIGL